MTWVCLGAATLPDARSLIDCSKTSAEVFAGVAARSFPLMQIFMSSEVHFQWVSSIMQSSHTQGLGCDAGGSIMNESITKAAGKATLIVELPSCRS